MAVVLALPSGEKSLKLWGSTENGCETWDVKVQGNEMATRRQTLKWESKRLAVLRRAGDSRAESNLKIKWAQQPRICGAPGLEFPRLMGRIRE